MPKPSTPAQYVILLIDLAENQGCERRQLLAGTSLETAGLAGIGARVSEDDFATLVSNAMALTADPALGLKLGLRLNLSAHAILGQAFMTCRDLTQVMDLFMRYYHLLAPGLRLQFTTTDTRCLVQIDRTMALEPQEFSYEMMYGGVLNTVRSLLNTPDLTMGMAFPYPQPEHASLYYEVFGPDIVFDAPAGRISWDSQLMHAPLPSSNEALLSLYEQECARLLADLQEEESIAEQTLRLLRKLEGQYPQMPQIAQMLNLSPRTYRRRLEAEDHAFQELLDQVRAEHASHYLRNTRLPLNSIAYIVGFNDASNFRRAYTRWTGRTPREIRNERP
jgi:AraC-like DNA-binding protein